MLLKVKFSLYYVLHLCLLRPTFLDKRAFVGQDWLWGVRWDLCARVCVCVHVGVKVGGFAAGSVLQLTHGPAHERW